MIRTAAAHGATNVRVFGSIARGEDTESGDIDLLVDLAGAVGVVALAAFECELQEILGRKVDVVPAVYLKPALKARVLAEAIPL